MDNFALLESESNQSIKMKWRIIYYTKFLI
jgi:hypothetical protein